MSIVGESIKRVDALGKVKGEAKYPGDINMPGQAYMKILFSDRAHAIIRKIEVTEAEKYQGVLAVFTAKDVPNNVYGLISPDQPVLCGPGSNREFADRVRFIGDQVALVIAETEQIAEHAARLIKVDYEDLPVVTDSVVAMNDEANLLHPDRGSNIFGHYRIRNGNVDEAFKKADVMIEGEYHTPVQEHAYLQPEAGICYVDEADKIILYVAGQWTHEDQEQIAHSLNLPLEKIRVIYPAIGGAFGGREDMSIQIVLALAAWRLDQRGIKRPIKIIWSREESMIGHHKRHPYIIKTKWGATKEGKVIAAEAELIADGGAYIYTSTKVMGNATLMCTGAYDIPNVKVDSYAVYTNNLPNGAFRGFGGPQGTFAAESQMNKLAEKLGMDPVELRMKNLLKEGSFLSVGSQLPAGVSLDKVVEKCALAAEWEKTQTGWIRPGGFAVTTRKFMKRGIGFACGYKNVGFSFGAPEQCTATIEIRGNTTIDKVILHHAGAEVGQGSHTVFAQMTAEACGVPFDKVELDMSDTETSGSSGSVSASRMTFMAGNSIRGAAGLALEKWQNEERPAIATYVYIPPKTTPFDPETGKCEPNFSYGYVAEAIEVEVDTETGLINILNVICADDVGKAVNPELVRGQIEGAIVQAAGYGVLENFIQRDGKVLTSTLSTYLIPTVLDIPEKVVSIIMEYPDPRGPWGARGVGEMPYIPFVPALTAAIHDATGVWFDEFPLTPERVLEGLGNL